MSSLAKPIEQFAGGLVSVEHLHHGLAIFAGMLLLGGAILLFGVVSKRLIVSQKVATVFMYAVCGVLAIGGVDHLSMVFFASRGTDPFSIEEWAIAAVVAIGLVVLLPWLVTRFLTSQEAIQSLRVGIEDTKRSAQLAQAECQAISARYAESTDALRLSVERMCRLGALVESSRDAIIGINEDGTVWQWNESAELLFKMPALEMIGKPVSIIRVNQSSDLWREVHRLSSPLYQRGGNELSIVMGNGSLLPVWVSISRVPASAGGAPGFAIVARDLSENKRVEEKISAALSEKILLLKEVHHRVKNNLQLICSLLRLQGKEVSDEETLKLFRKSEDRIRSLALVHEKLYQTQSLSSLDFGGYVRDLVGQLVRSAELSGAKISTSFDIQSIFFSVDNAITCGLIINELVANSLKHREGPELKMHVGLSRSGATVTFVVRDDGRKVIDPQLFENPTTLGLKLVRSLTRQLGGQISINQDCGTEWRIELPAQTVVAVDVDRSHAGLAA